MTHQFFRKLFAIAFVVGFLTLLYVLFALMSFVSIVLHVLALFITMLIVIWLARTVNQWLKLW